jgi:hypothetical protein
MSYQSSAYGALPAFTASGEGPLATHLGRSPQLSRRAASGHDGLKAFRRRFRSTSTTRKATVSILDGETKRLWDAPVHTPALRWEA